MKNLRTIEMPQSEIELDNVIKANYVYTITTAQNNMPLVQDMGRAIRAKYNAKTWVEVLNSGRFQVNVQHIIYRIKTGEKLPVIVWQGLPTTSYQDMQHDTNRNLPVPYNGSPTADMRGLADSFGSQSNFMISTLQDELRSRSEDYRSMQDAITNHNIEIQNILTNHASEVKEYLEQIADLKSQVKELERTLENERWRFTTEKSLMDEYRKREDRLKSREDELEKDTFSLKDVMTMGMPLLQSYLGAKGGIPMAMAGMAGMNGVNGHAPTGQQKYDNIEPDDVEEID